MIVGFSGYARAGKDTAGAALVDSLHYQRASFADALRTFLYTLNPQAAYYAPMFKDDEDYLFYDSVQTIVDRHGWDWAKDHSAREGWDPHPQSIRAQLQRLGTDCGRKLLGEDVWVDLKMSTLEDGADYVFTDVRFPNEADAIKARGGFVVRIDREGTGPANDHPSETALDDYPFDFRMSNDDTEFGFVLRVVSTFDALGRSVKSYGDGPYSRDIYAR